MRKVELLPTQDCEAGYARAQVANIIKAANFQLVNIGRARKLPGVNCLQLGRNLLFHAYN